MQDIVYNFHVYFYLYEHCGSCLKKKHDINSCKCDRHNCMLALIPVLATDGCDCIFKTKENIVIEFKGGLTSGSLNGHFCHITLCNKTLVPPMNGLFVWYWKCLLAFITSIMHKQIGQSFFLNV